LRKGHKAPVIEAPVAAIPPRVSDVAFTVRGPIAAPAILQVSETLPLLSVVFFDAGSTDIPTRYVLLTKEQAPGFKEGSVTE